MQAQLTAYQERINRQLDQQLQFKLNNTPTKLIEAVRYATLNNGKRLRPALIYAIGEALSIPLEKLDAAACAIELIHSYSLVHDDLPAMDDDELRRGKPTCHIQFDEATAILVGDAQQTLAFELLANDPLLEADTKIELIRLLGHASGVAGMIGGQMIDIESEGNLPSLSELKNMHLMKTGAIIQCALLMGACQSTRYQQLKPTIEQYGAAIGLAFQVQDDILDIESDTETLGKPQGSDLEADKSTYPKLLGIEEAKNYRDQLINDAIVQLQQADINSTFLTDITHYIAQRNH